MSLVATLISARARPSLTADLPQRLAEALGRPSLAHRWLEPAVALDLEIPASTGEIAALTAALRTAVAGAPIDVVVQPSAGRRKYLLIADMDSTMIGQECIDELAAEVGLKDHVAAITEKAMRGEIAFEPALRERVALLQSLPETIAATVIAERITLTPGGRELIATMRANGGYTALVSGGFTLFTRPIARMLGFDETSANELLIEDGRLAGRVAEPILGQSAKREHLIRLTAERGLTPAATMAVGDGANDLAMIREAGIGVADHAKPAVAAEAGARIDHADLTALLFMQGYAAADFVTA